MQDLYLYGSGHRCQILLELLKETDVNIAGIIDSDDAKWGMEVGAYKILSSEALEGEQDCCVCVTFYSTLVNEPVWEVLEVKYGIPREKIYSFHDMLIYIFSKKRVVGEGNSFDDSWKFFFDGSWKMGLGGVETWLKDVVLGLVSSGCENVSLLTQKGQENMPEVVETHIEEFFYECTPEFSEENVKKGVDFLLEKMPCTIVFARVDELMLAAYLIKQIYPNKIRIIMSDHGSCDGMYRDIFSYREMIDMYVCVSTGIKEELANRGLKNHNLEIMTCPVAREENMERCYTLDEKKSIQIGYAGRLEIFEKRIDILQKVILELEKKGVNYHLYIAGTGSQYSHMKEFLSVNNLERNVSLLGRISHEKIAEFWQKMDISLNTSDNEGRPLSNMEAMINGAVPVVTRTIGVLDDVSDGENGYIVPINDYNSMADRIAYLERNRYKLVELGKNAREELLGKSSLSTHVKLWRSVLEI